MSNHEHSKEPWSVGLNGAIVCGPPGANRIGGANDVSYYGGHMVAESVCEADARRACAAVNACTDIPTDELEMLVRAGKRLTAHGEPRPTAEEQESWQRFLFGHWTKKPPTVPGFYIATGIDPDDNHRKRAACEVTGDDLRAVEEGSMDWTVEWWWSCPLAVACLTSPSELAKPRADGSAREPISEAMRALGLKDPPRVVCLVGSMRFHDAFRRAEFDEERAGRIVLSAGFDPAVAADAHGGTVSITPEQKAAVDELYMRKIDLADEILVLNVGGYVGESTRREIEYAKRYGKTIRWLEGT